MMRPLHIAMIVGEHSGDQLGFKLIRALRERHEAGVRVTGVAGDAMRDEGATSLFPLSDIAVMGVGPVIARLPLLIRRVLETAKAVTDSPPDALVIIDSPDFTHAVARRVRRRLPKLPIIDYVSPSVWAWRPGRARRMRAYIDHVLALLPFEPEAHIRLGGPDCSYVGHPLIERLEELRPGPQEEALRASARPVVLVLPGSRSAEVARLAGPFGASLGLVASQNRDMDLVLPAVSHLEPQIRAAVAAWPVAPRIVVGEAEKLAAFRRARAALAASGTVTLELALAGVPMVVSYRVSRLEEPLKYFIKVPSIVLPNLVLGRQAIPEILQHDATAERLAEALIPLLGDTVQRAQQLAAFDRLDDLMTLPGGETPSGRAAAIVLEEIARRSRPTGPGAAA